MQAVGVTVAEGFVNTVGGAFVVSAALGGGNPDSFPDNVIPLPLPQKDAVTPSEDLKSCSKDGDPEHRCDEWYKLLKSWRGKLTFRLQQLYRADFAFQANADAHQNLIQEIKQFNDTVDNYDLICVQIHGYPPIEKIPPISRVIPGRRTGPSNPTGNLTPVK